MATNSSREPDATPVRRHTRAARGDVWAVLADGWVYPGWVVGASRMRAVEPGYPGVGTALHHSVGTWPALLDDETRVVECEEGHRLVLEAKAWPVGTARVAVTLTDTLDGGTLIEMREDASRGPARLLPGAVRQQLITRRNDESLTRLAMLAERASHPGRSADRR